VTLTLDMEYLEQVALETVRLGKEVFHMGTGTVLAAALVVLFLLFRASLAFLYSSFKRTRPRWPLWAGLALFWGVWSLPFWLLFALDHRDLARDLRKVWAFRRLLDRANMLNLLFVFILAQALSLLAMMPILLMLLVRFEGVHILASMSEMVVGLSRPWAILLVLVYLNGTLVALVHLWAVEPGWLTYRELGLTTEHLGRNIVIGLLMGVVLLAVSAVLEYLIGLFVPPDLPGYLDPESDYLAAGNTAGFLVFLFGATVLAPIGEEIYFRGFLYCGLSARYRLPVVFLVSSAYFSLGHLNLIYYPIFLFAGGLLIYVRHKCQSLVPSIIMHAVNNFTAVGLAYLFST